MTNALLERLSNVDKTDEDVRLFTELIYKMLGCQQIAIGAYFMGIYKFKELMKAGYKYDVAAIHAMSYGIIIYSPREEQEEVRAILKFDRDEGE
jgi:hypothetical protein